MMIGNADFIIYDIIFILTVILCVSITSITLGSLCATFMFLGILVGFIIAKIFYLFWKLIACSIQKFESTLSNLKSRKLKRKKKMI